MKGIFHKIVAGAVVPVLLVLLAGLIAFPGCGMRTVLIDKALPQALPQAPPLPEPDPELVAGVIENGFQYVLMENSRPESRVTMHLVVAAGSFHEKDEEQGLAHYLEHMLFNGTTHFPPGELIKYFQSIGMRFGNDANARTGFFQTVYDLHLPSGDRESLEKALRVMGDYAGGALLLEAEVERERDIILAEKRTRDSVSYRTFKAEMEFELPGSRLIRRYPIGSKEVIRVADSELLRGFYDAWYRPEKLTLVMVGDFDADQAEELIRETFSPMKARAQERPVPDFGRTEHAGTKALYHYEEEAGRANITIETIIQESLPPDSIAYRTSRQIRNMAYRILNYRLGELEESPDPPFTTASAQAGWAFRQYRYASVTASCDPEKWEGALVGLERSLRKAFLYGFTEAEVERARREVLSELDRAVKQKDTRESGSLARGIVHSLATDRVFSSPEQKQQLLAPVVEAATPEQLHQALLETWDPPFRLVLVTGSAEIDDAGGASAEEHILSVFEAGRARAVEPPPSQEAPVFPYLARPSTSGNIVDQETFDDIGVARIDFANGVRLNIKATDFKANQVVIKLGFGEGRSGEPEDRQAMSELGEAVINQSGFDRLTKDQLRQALAGKQASISLSVAENSFYLNGFGASDEIDLLFQLLYAFYMDFGCHRDAHERVLRIYEQKYNELSHTIAGAMALSGQRFFAGGDTRFGLPPGIEAWREIPRDDIRDWMDRSLRRQPPEISVVGDFEEEAVIRAAADYFGAMALWDDDSEDVAPRPNPSFPAGEALALRIPTRIPRGFVNVAWPTDDFRDVHRTRRLSVLADIVSDRMRREIREEAGLAYSQYAYHRASLAYEGYGVFHAIAEVAPADIEAVVVRVQSLAADIVRDGVSDDELARARDPIITSIKEMVKTNSYWLNSVLSGSRSHPPRLDWSRGLLEDYESITAAEVTDLARQYLDNTAAALVTIKPREEAAAP